MAENLNLYQKLARIRKMTEVITKNRAGFNYRYTSIDEILARVTAGMNKYNVSLIPRVVPGSASSDVHTFEKTKFTKDGVMYEEKNYEMISYADMTFTWVDDDNPDDRIEVPWFVTGSQVDPAQAFGSGLTYGLRQFLLQYFQIASLDKEDPDDWRSKQREAETLETRLMAEAINDQINTLVNERMESHPEDKPKVQAIVKKFAKANGKPTANYYAIEDPKVSSELLSVLKTEFSVGEEK